MEYRIVVAHSSRNANVHSEDNVKIITKAYTPLSFNDAINYFNTGNPKAEYASAAIGTCTPLSDSDYKDLFGKTPPAGNGLLPTAKSVVPNGRKIYALRNEDMSLNDISEWAKSFNGKVILVACRDE